MLKGYARVSTEVIGAMAMHEAVSVWLSAKNLQVAGSTLRKTVLEEALKRRTQMVARFTVKDLQMIAADSNQKQREHQKIGQGTAGDQKLAIIRALSVDALAGKLDELADDNQIDTGVTGRASRVEAVKLCTALRVYLERYKGGRKNAI